MRLFPPLLSYVLLVILGAIFVIRGLVPALTRIDSDFPNYYVAARIVCDGKPVGRLYDDAWFQQQIRSYGIEQQGKFSPFPPVTALVMVPLAGLDPIDALRVTTVLNVLLLVGLVMLLSRTLSLHLLDTSVFVFLTGHALINCFRLGQCYLLATLLMVAGYHASMNNKQLLSGFLLGLFIPIKYFAIIVVVYCVFKRQWRVVFAACATMLLVAGTGIVVMGWDIHREFLMSVLGEHLGSHLFSQNPFSATFQSWDSLLRRLMVYDESMNRFPAMDGSEYVPYVKAAIIAGIVVASTLTIIRAHRHRALHAASLTILGITGLLIAPATGTYHYLLLLLPIGLFLAGGMYRSEKTIVYMVLGLHAIIGFIPYSFTQQFDGRGVLTVLAYPRLAALSILYGFVIATVWRTEDRAQEPHGAGAPGG